LNDNAVERGQVHFSGESRIREDGVIPKNGPVPVSASEETGSARTEAAEFEASLRREHPWVWWTTLIGPPAAVLLVLGLLGALHGWGYVRKLVATAVATFFFFGRFVILGGESPSSATGSRFFSAEVLVALVLVMDLVCACLIAFHAGFLWKLPVVGPRIQALADEGRALADAKPWVRRATFASITAFVMFPLAATGSIGGSLFGRLLGMGRAQTFLAVLLGSLLGCGLMYFGAVLIRRHLDRDSLLVTIGGPVVIAAMIVVLTYRFRKLTSATRRPAQGDRA
jgi:uncharacterized membrane protein